MKKIKLKFLDEKGNLRPLDCLICELKKEYNKMQEFSEIDSKTKPYPYFDTSEYEKLNELYTLGISEDNGKFMTRLNDLVEWDINSFHDFINTIKQRILEGENPTKTQEWLYELWGFHSQFH